MTKNITGNKKTKPSQSIWVLIAILILLSMIGISARFILISDDSLSGGDSLWRLNITASTHAIPEETTLTIYPPFDTANIRTIQRNVSYPGFKIRRATLTGEQKLQRYTHLIATDKGKQEISAEYLLHLSQSPFTSVTNKTALKTNNRERFLLDDSNLQYKSYAVKETLNKILAHLPNQDNLANEIYAFAKSIPISTGKDITTVPKILTRHKATIYDRALVMISLSRAIGIPARLVSGLILKDDIDPQPHYWVELYQNDQWSPYDIHFDYKKSLPSNYLPLRRNDKDIIQANNGTFNDIKFDLEREFNHPYLRKKQKEQLFSIFDLTRLPLDVRNELALLLLLPLGALITALFRHLVGVHSYGVFTPTLLALAIVYTNIVTTLTIFIVVISIAVAGRSLFPASLTRVPRLSIIFTLIAIILTMSVSVFNYFNIDQGGKIILLPIIILTSLVDRFYRTIDDRGIKIAIRRLVWTMMIALLCLPVIQFETLGHLILEYPELHLITLALFLLISLYKGKLLIHLPLIKILAEPENIKEKG